VTDTPAHGCTIDGQPAMPVLIADYNQLVNRANEAEQRLRNIANGHPRADAIQAEIGEMITQTHELRNRLRAAEAANDRVRRLAARIRQGVPWAANVDSLADRILSELDGQQPGPATAQATEPGRWLLAGSRDLSIPAPEPSDPTQCSGEEGFCPEHGFHRHSLKQPGAPEPEPEDLTGAYMPDPPIGCLLPDPLTTAEEARLAQDGIDTPGCDCGHTGMGVSWHADDCAWRSGVVDCPGRPTPG
jgi:hypothetical protein